MLRVCLTERSGSPPSPRQTRCVFLLSSGAAACLKLSSVAVNLNSVRKVTGERFDRIIAYELGGIPDPVGDSIPAASEWDDPFGSEPEDVFDDIPF